MATLMLVGINNIELPRLSLVQSVRMSGYNYGPSLIAKHKKLNLFAVSSYPTHIPEAVIPQQVKNNFFTST